MQLFVMTRKILLSGFDHSFFIGNHQHVHISLNEQFDIRGLVYCPRYDVRLTVSGDGKVAFRGMCNRLIIVKTSGDCIVDLSSLIVNELSCYGLGAASNLVVGVVKKVSELNLDPGARISSNFPMKKYKVVSPAAIGKLR
jgi:hypothetical protein